MDENKARTAPVLLADGNGHEEESQAVLDGVGTFVAGSGDEKQALPVTPKTQEPQAEIVRTWPELRGFWRVFALSEWIMRDRQGFFEEVRLSKDLGAKLRGMVLSSLVCLALFGAVMGMSHSWLQALTSAVKLPVLFLVTLLICLPTLYFFNLLYGSQLTFTQTAALLMAAITIGGALTLAFASISWFFWLTIGEQYTILILLNVGILGISSWWGLSFLRQGMRYVQRDALNVSQGRILATWLVIYAFVGTQMGWALRPFFGVPDTPFVFIRTDGGTFYGSILTALGWLLRTIFGY
ncbi:MAG: actin-binding WH2 domain-containing protein [Anaerolineae bacterium]|nr:actin-binding WH2 domain-containing protein [Anaerolineae bacterium]